MPRIVTVVEVVNCCKSLALMKVDQVEVGSRQKLVFFDVIENSLSMLR